MATYTKLPSGKWRAQIRKSGFYRGKTFDLKRDAQAWVTSVESQMQGFAATGKIDSSATMGQLVDAYLKEKPDIGRTKKYCTKKIGLLMKDDVACKLTIHHIEKYLDTIQKVNNCSGQILASHLSYMSALLHWASIVKKLNVPLHLTKEALGILRHKGIRTRSKGRTRRPTQKELDTLYEFWRLPNRRIVPMETITRFAIASCMRLNEIMTIMIEDVDREKRTVIIRQRKDPQNKEDNDQIVPLLGEAWTIVEEAIGDRTEGRIFPYHRHTTSDCWTRHCKKLGIKDLHFHDLRHEGISRLFEKGLQIQHVAMVSGHKSWEHLKRYTQLKPDSLHAFFD